MTFSTNCFENTTGVSFPDEIKWLLTLGNKFALPISQKNFPLLHVIADMKVVIQDIEDHHQKGIARSKFCNTISSFKRKFKNTNVGKFILKIHEKCIEFLKEHKDIAILKSD